EGSFERRSRVDGGGARGVVPGGVGRGALVHPLREPAFARCLRRLPARARRRRPVARAPLTRPAAPTTPLAAAPRCVAVRRTRWGVSMQQVRRAALADLVGASPHLRDVVLVPGASLVTGLLAQAEIRLPFTPVPVTLQPLAVFLVGAALGSRRGALA